MRVTVCLLALTLAAGDFGAQAAPLGKAQCGLASLKTAASMQAANDALDTMATLAVNGNDATMADAVNEAQAGLQDAGGAFQGIASAIRNKVAAKAAGAGLGAKGLQGLTAAKSVLDQIKAAKGGAAAGPLAKAKAKLAEALANGKQVAQCGDAAAADATATAAADATAIATAADAAATDAAAADPAAGESVDPAGTPPGTPPSTPPGTPPFAPTKQTKTPPGSPPFAPTTAGDNVDPAGTPPGTPPFAPTKQTKTQTPNTKNQSEKRQFLKALGGIGCNVARVQTVAGLAASSKALAKVTTAAAADPAAADAAATAKTGLDSAKAGIATIAKDIVAGQAPSAAARTQTEDGLTAAKTALAGITSTDPAVTAAVADAAAKVDKTIAAGGKVVDKC